MLLRLRLLLEPRVLWLLQHGRYALAQRVSERRGHDGIHAAAWHTTFEFATHDGVIQRYQTRCIRIVHSPSARCRSTRRATGGLGRRECDSRSDLRRAGRQRVVVNGANR